MVKSILGIGGYTGVFSAIPVMDEGRPKLNVFCGGRRTLAHQRIDIDMERLPWVPMFVFSNGGRGDFMSIGSADNIRTELPGSFDRCVQVMRMHEEGLGIKEMAGRLGMGEDVVQNYINADQVAPEVKEMWKVAKISVKAAGILYEMYPDNTQRQIKIAEQLSALTDIKTDYKILGFMQKNPSWDIYTAINHYRGRRKLSQNVNIPLNIWKDIKSRARKHGIKVHVFFRAFLGAATTGQSEVPMKQIRKYLKSEERK